MSFFFKALMAYSFPVFLNSASRTWTETFKTSQLRTNTRRSLMSSSEKRLNCYLPKVSSAQNWNIFVIVHLHPCERRQTKSPCIVLNFYIIYRICVYMCMCVYFGAETGWSSLPSVLFMDDCNRDKVSQWFTATNHIPISIYLLMFLFFSTWCTAFILYFIIYFSFILQMESQPCVIWLLYFVLFWWVIKSSLLFVFAFSPITKESDEMLQFKWSNFHFEAVLLSNITNILSNMTFLKTQ